MVVTFGLCGLGVLVAAPLIGSMPSAAADGTRVVALAEPTTPDPADTREDNPEYPIDPEVPSDPVVTVTVTTTPPEEEPAPEVTTTVTVKPSKKPTTKQPEEPEPPTTPPTSNLSVPSQPIEIPPANTATEPPATPTEEELLLPTVAEQVTTSPPVTPSEVASTPDSVSVELREAAPEFDEVTISQQLGIPALVLVLLALFGVLIFEGRLRRMAHAAAVRKAGPRPAGRHSEAAEYTGYPAGPGYISGYAQTNYPGGTAYAPIISFVPVQTYPSPYGYQEDYPSQQYAEQPVEEVAPEPPPLRDLPPEPAAEAPRDLTPFDAFSKPTAGSSSWFEPTSTASPSGSPGPDVAAGSEPAGGPVISAEDPLGLGLSPAPATSGSAVGEKPIGGEKSIGGEKPFGETAGGAVPDDRATPPSQDEKAGEPIVVVDPPYGPEAPASEGGSRTVIEPLPKRSGGDGEPEVTAGGTAVYPAVGGAPEPTAEASAPPAKRRGLFKRRPK
jgi:hypothetical protein